MKVSYRRFGILAAFAAMLVLLLLNAAWTRREIDLQTRNQAAVAHTREVLLSLRSVEVLLADAETGQRGFLFTGNPKYLEPYSRAVENVAAGIDHLQQITAESSTQQARVAVLRQLTEQKLGELAKTIALVRSGKPEQARELVLSDQGKLIMDRIRGLVDVMEHQEVDLENQRVAASHGSIERTRRSLFGTTAIAVIGLVLLAFFIRRQIQQRERHAAEIHNRQEWFRVTLISIGDAVIATDAEGRVSFLNPLAEQLTGYTLEEARERPVQEVFAIFNEQSRKPVENPVGKVLELGQVMGLANHTVLRSRSGKEIPIEDSAAPIRDGTGRLIGVVMVFRDVTRERRTQELLRRTEKLAAAGRLASTVAHEINNPLEAVCNLIYILKYMPELPPAALAHVVAMERQLERISHVTRQTLGFYRESSSPNTVEIRPLVESILDLYRNKLEGKGITVQLEIDPGLKITGFSGELKQLVANLVSNAADAVSANGRINIRAGRVQAPEGAGMELRVEDDGPGIDPENLPKIFEPFFTTKHDVGTGLGLWVVKNVVDHHGGSVQAISRDENGSRGAVFSVFLPLPASALASTERGA